MLCRSTLGGTEQTSTIMLEQGTRRKASRSLCNMPWRGLERVPVTTVTKARCLGRCFSVLLYRYADATHFRIHFFKYRCFIKSGVEIRNTLNVGGAHTPIANRLFSILHNQGFNRLAE